MPDRVGCQSARKHGKVAPMPYDAFISYCSEDKKIADAVCGTLEANKIRCWIAPRDVGPGRTWGSAIVEAIGESAVMVVIFSQHSNGSPQVMREIERAVNKGVAIIPFRVENVVPSKDLEYFISSCHWLDAMNPRPSSEDNWQAMPNSSGEPK